MTEEHLLMNAKEINRLEVMNLLKGKRNRQAVAVHQQRERRPSFGELV